jgi:hypothetical protein
MKISKQAMYSIAGAALAITSTALMIDYSVRKRKDQTPPVGILFASIAGLVAGAAIAYQPQREQAKLLKVDEIFDDETEVDTLEENINEVLNLSEADEQTEEAPVRKSIEVDNDTSIEDFIWTES